MPDMYTLALHFGSSITSSRRRSYYVEKVNWSETALNTSARDSVSKVTSEFDPLAVLKSTYFV